MIRQNLEGQTFGKLTAIEYLRKNKKGFWICICECGNNTIVEVSNLKSNHIISCGCAKYSIEVRQKISQSQRLRFENKKDEKNRKQPWTEESREKARQKTKIQFSNAEARKKAGEKTKAYFEKNPEARVRARQRAENQFSNPEARKKSRQIKLSCSEDEFKHYLLEKYGLFDISLLGKVWRGSKTGNIKISCVAHEHESIVSAYWLLRQIVDGCPVCYPQNEYVRQRARYRRNKILVKLRKEIEISCNINGDG